MCIVQTKQNIKYMDVTAFQILSVVLNLTLKLFVIPWQQAMYLSLYLITVKSSPVKNWFTSLF